MYRSTEVNIIFPDGSSLGSSATRVLLVELWFRLSKTAAEVPSQVWVWLTPQVELHPR